jgi:indolepyruvate ferredoxin oxidoreductase, alpha subunit
MRELLSGNEAVARGVYEAGVAVAAAYPGTPSTEILENVSRYKEVYSEWSPNEKSALEVALGASFTGRRAFAAMKHVGLNVAADPLFSAAYIGATGGLVIVTADDPGLHSSQNEQDNRLYGKFAKIPVIEPSDSQESKDFILRAFEISEKYQTPVLFRMSTRVCHALTPVELGERTEPAETTYKKDFDTRVLIPSNARTRHVDLEERLLQLKEFSETGDLNVEIEGDPSIGIISSGIAFQYAREAFPDASFLKLGISFPFPDELVKSFAAKVETLYVVEENEPFIEEHVRLAGIPVVGKEKIPLCNELSQRIVRESLTDEKVRFAPAAVPPRPPVLCPGCPHRSTFMAIRRQRLHSMGDIGCYTLGALPPLNAMDSCVCMGASITTAHGLQKALPPEEGRKTVAVIGDSTFVHTGISGLINVAYNKGTTTTVIVDNSITAMTGHQEHPGSGKTLSGEDTVKVDYELLARAVGIKRFARVDAYDVKAVAEALKTETSVDEASLIVSEGPCILRNRAAGKIVRRVDEELCINCGMCRKTGCPAIMKNKAGDKSFIAPTLCAGEVCNVCAQVCPKDAIQPVEN